MFKKIKTKEDLQGLSNLSFWLAVTNYLLMILLFYLGSPRMALLNALCGLWCHFNYWMCERIAKDYERIEKED